MHTHLSFVPRSQCSQTGFCLCVLTGICAKGIQSCILSWALSDNCKMFHRIMITENTFGGILNVP